MYQITSIGHDEAQIAIQTVMNEALQRGKAVVIAVADNHGEMIALLRMDGAKLPAITIAMNKAFTAARELKPTFELGQRSRNPETSFDFSFYGDNRFVGWGGGYPVFLDKKVIGAIAVSGLPQQEDMELAQIGLDAIIKSLEH